MKLSLYKKIWLGYLVIVLLTYALLSTLASRLVWRGVLEDARKALFDEAYLLTETYGTDVRNRTISDKGETLKLAAKASSAQIWIMDREGQIFYTTSPETTPLTLPAFDPTESEKGNAFYGKFYDSFTENYLTVFSPVAGNYTTYGYILVHQSYKTIAPRSNNLLYILYWGACIVLVLVLLLILEFHLVVLRPLNKIGKAAREYAEGNLTYPLKWQSNDEMGALAASVSYMADSLNGINEDQRKFIANVSHDFRSPLTSIKGYVEAISDGTIPPEMMGKYLSIVLDETDRLNKLTQSLLELNAFSKDGLYLEMTDFDIASVIKKILATFEGRCGEKGITFDLTVSEEARYVHADMGRIQQVLYNLIDNAIKFSNPNSAIDIRTELMKDKVYISVKDEGAGISPKDLKKIWNRFFKTDTSRGKDKKGLGLGLSITKEIIHAHGESIDVVSTEGVGTTFTFTLQKGIPQP